MLQWMNFEDVMPMEVLVAQFCPTLWDPMDAPPPPPPPAPASLLCPWNY